ncbi:MAG: DUF2877 domain-containing protein [Halanaerobiales bacterium]|nr:DUF2877 domain-containing protein [Halanaerobiales bacterium]
MINIVEGDLVRENYNMQGTVISVFDHVINVRTSNESGYAVTDNLIGLTPYHLKISNKYFSLIKKTINKKSSFFLSNKKIKSGSFNIKLERKKYYEGKICINHKDNINKVIYLTEKVIKEIDNKSSLNKTILNYQEIIKNNKSFDLTPLQKYFYQLLSNIVFSNSSVKPLIGLGIGLTPTGDDFLIGYLSAIESFKIKDKYNIKKCLLSADIFNLTNILSGLQIKAALQRRYNEKLYNFYKNISNNEQIYMRSLKELIETGSSSGLDLLAGIYFALTM